MNIEKWLVSSKLKLDKENISTSRLDSLVLLEDILKKDRAWILAHQDEQLSNKHLEILNQQITNRTSHMPLAYIRGITEFYGNNFLVNRHTLVPRPESETIIETLIKLSNQIGLDNNQKKVQIIDIGTGSGALAISVKLIYPSCSVFATDISKNALQVANKNQKLHQVNIKMIQGDLIDPIVQLFKKNTTTVILANLPYVPNDHTINKAAMFEPRTAIFGGSDGLDFYRRLFSRINLLTNIPGFLIVESLPTQHAKLSKIAKNSGYQQIIDDDFIQVFKK